MGIGDMLGKAAGSLGGMDAITEKLGAAGIDPSALAGMDAEAVKTMLADKGIDLSMLEGMGLSVDDLIAKVTGG